MERILEVYKRPYDPLFPVVCMDESPNVYSTQSGHPFQSKPDTQSTGIWTPSPVISDTSVGAKRRCYLVLTLFSSFKSSLLSFFSLILLQVLSYERCEPAGPKWRQPKSDRLSVHASAQSVVGWSPELI
jgi:hypothetical protein